MPEHDLPRTSFFASDQWRSVLQSGDNSRGQIWAGLRQNLGPHANIRGKGQTGKRTIKRKGLNCFGLVPTHCAAKPAPALPQHDRQQRIFA